MSNAQCRWQQRTHYFLGTKEYNYLVVGLHLACFIFFSEATLLLGYYTVIFQKLISLPWCMKAALVSNSMGIDTPPKGQNAVLVGVSA